MDTCDWGVGRSSLVGEIIIFQAKNGIRDGERSLGLGHVYTRQGVGTAVAVGTGIGGDVGQGV